MLNFVAVTPRRMGADHVGSRRHSRNSVMSQLSVEMKVMAPDSPQLTLGLEAVTVECLSERNDALEHPEFQCLHKCDSSLVDAQMAEQV